MTQEMGRRDPPRGNKNNEQPRPDCAEIQALIPAFSIGATDPEETERVLAALADCPEVIAELGDFSRLSEGLLFSLPQQTPPPQLADNLRAALEEAPAEKQSFPPVAPAPAQPQTRQKPPQPSLWNRLTSGFRPQLAAGFAALLLLLIVSNGYWLIRLDTLQNRYNALVQQQDAQASFIAFTNPDNLQRIELAAAGEEAPNARAVVVYEPGRDQALLYAENFPPLEEEQVYQLWLIAGETPVSGGLFQLDPQNGGLLVFDAPQALDAYDAFGVTPEPAGGSPGPTGPLVVLGSF